MITPEERRSIIDEAKAEAKEEILLTLPKVWSSLFVEMKAQSELKAKFYEDNPELLEHENAVSSIFGEVAGEFPNLDFKDQAKKALPRIKRRIDETKNISMTVPKTKPSTEFKPLESSLDIDNGAI